MAKHTLSNGWYDEGFFIQSIRKDGVATGYCVRNRGRGSSVLTERMNNIIVFADAGVALSDLAEQHPELFKKSA